MTNEDIKQISQLLDEKLDQKLDEKLKPIQKTLDQHTKILDEHSKILEQHSKLHSNHTKSLKSLKKDQDVMLKMLDKEQMEQRKRLNRVEDRLDFSSSTS